VTAHQASKKAVDSKVTRAGMVAEDWSIVGTADTVLTYSRTEQEFKRGLARIMVEHTRANVRDHFMVLISQAYATGQFCLDDCMMSRTVHDQVDKINSTDDEEDDE
jgi:hypothetical protein